MTRVKKKFVISPARVVLAGTMLIMGAVPMLMTHASISAQASEDPLALHAQAHVRAGTGTYQPGLDVRGVARGRVEIEGGLLAVAWDGAGVVKRVLVNEGDEVVDGTPVLELERQSEHHAVAHARVQLALAQNAHAVIAAQLPYARSLEQRLKEGVSTGGIDAQRLIDAREKTAVLTLRLAGAQAGIDAATQALSAANWEFDRRLLRARGAGVVVGMHARVGQSVASGSPTLLSVLPDKPRYVRAEVNEYFIDAISPGMRAFVSQDLTNARDQKSTEGRVLRVSPVYRTGVLDEPSEHGHAHVVNVIVSLPVSNDLKVGQSVKVKFYE